jgi:hypothetical protein
VSKKPLHAPKHLTAHAIGSPRKAVRNALVLSAVAAVATGVCVSGGVLSAPSDKLDTMSSGLADHVSAVADGATPDTSSEPPALSAEELAKRKNDVEASRSDNREELDTTKQAVLSAAGGRAVTVTDDVSDDDPRDIAKALLPEFGFSASEFSCLDSLYMSESGWRVDADNPSSSAYGIPQALPGSKMASAGPNWATNPATQIRWGLGYIADRYGTPCGAWSFKQGHNWY